MVNVFEESKNDSLWSMFVCSDNMSTFQGKKKGGSYLS